MSDFDDLLFTCIKEQNPETLADKIIQETEHEIKFGNDDPKIEKEKELESIKDYIKNLSKELSKYKTQNHRKVGINQKLAKKRKELKNKIKQLEVRLDEIKIESKRL